jgi:hypothetical protein
MANASARAISTGTNTEPCGFESQTLRPSSLSKAFMHEGLTWEIDEFLGENAGLVVAEVELVSEDQKFARPPWVTKEVTTDARYFNSSLATKPFSNGRCRTCCDLLSYVLATRR